MADADAAVFGANRQSLLEHLTRDYPEAAWWMADPDGVPVAWLLARPGAGSTEIGPWCGTPEAAPSLLDAALVSLAGQAMELSSPAENELAADVLAARGFTRVGHHVRMRHGEPVVWDRARTWALGGLEKG